MKSASNADGESRVFFDWMGGLDLSIGIAAEGDHDLIFLGRHEDGGRSSCSRRIGGSHKLCFDGETLWLSTRNHMWQFENCLPGIPTPLGCDWMFLSTLGISTGEIGVKDIVVEAHGRVVFVSSLNGCLATIRNLNCIVPFWRPPVNSTWFDAERCFLSGLASSEGYSKYVTVFGGNMKADRRGDRNVGQGGVIDIESNEIVATDLSMPCSPRIYDGLLWLLNAGTGHMGFVDLATGNFHDVLGFRGSLECLAFHGDFAIVGISNSRKYVAMDRINRDTVWSKSSDVARCEIQVIDMKSGVATSRFTLPRGIHKINDVVVLPGIRMPGVVRPQAVGFDLDQRDTWFQGGSGEPLKQTAVT